jgi:RNA polymerase sigma factor (sigma-70 family)
MIDFTSLYDTYIDGLFKFGTKFTTDRELVKDCIQDIFVKLYTKRGELDLIDNFKSYLYTSLKNRINDEFRRNAHDSDEEVSDKQFQKLNETEIDILTSKEEEDLNNKSITYFFKQLSPRQRQIITLYYIEQRKYEDICDIMGINYQSVRNLMHRSLTKLRNLAAQKAGHFKELGVRS